MSHYALPALFIAVTCFAIISICVCRIGKIDKSFKLRVGIKYIVLLLGSAAYAMAPYLREFQGWTGAAFSASVLFLLLAESKDWRHPEVLRDLTQGET
jgi:predicted CDP-diglyceride synthetase/phosphatidate cytidylyltransferase